jgi:Acyl-CoA carboxylase epsilon subunit
MEPRFTIVRGNPSPEEIAAVVTVLTAVLERTGGPGSGETKRSRWSSRSRLLRGPLSRGPDGWRASALPR